MRLTKNIVMVACVVTMYLTIDRGGLYAVAGVLASLTAAGLIVLDDRLIGGNVNVK